MKLNRHPRQGSLGVNRKRRKKRFAENYGSEARVHWFHEMRCVCKGKHPACSGRTQVSHTRSKAVEGDASDCIPQSAGCHRYIGTKGWRQWQIEVGDLLELGGPLDRFELAADLAMFGPDAPKELP